MTRDDTPPSSLPDMLGKVRFRPLISELPPPDTGPPEPFAEPASPITERPGRLLVVVVRPERRTVMEQLVREDGYEVRFLDPGADLIAACDEFDPDVILLSSVLPGGYALLAVSALRGAEEKQHTPIVLLGEVDDEASVARFLLSGADDYVRDLARPIELRARVRVQLRNKRFYEALVRVRGERDSFRRHANIDPLTGLLNRRALEQRLASLYQQREPYGLLFFDLDHFKDVNDSYGHDVGDYVLEVIARTAECCLRPGDALGRYGGEEFLVILADANLAITRSVAERLRSAIERARLQRDGPEHVTVSVGATVHDPVEAYETVDVVLRRADRALYHAKQSGRNRVSVLDVKDPLPPAPGSTRPIGVRNDNPNATSE